LSIPLDHYEYGSRPRSPEYILMLISEMEGTWQHLKYMGFTEDAKVIEEMRKPYYKLYFQTIKNQKH